MQLKLHIFRRVNIMQLPSLSSPDRCAGPQRAAQVTVVIVVVRGVSADSLVAFQHRRPAGTPHNFNLVCRERASRNGARLSLNAIHPIQLARNRDARTAANSVIHTAVARARTAAARPAAGTSAVGAAIEAACARRHRKHQHD